MALQACRLAGLQDENTFYDMTMRYSTRRGFYNSSVAYPWQETTYYWMVISLYSQMRAKCLGKLGLHDKCREELHKMAKRIKAG